MIDPDNLANAVAIEGGKVQNYWKEREAKGWVPSYYDNDQGALGTFADAFMGGLETTVGEGLLGVGAALNYVSDDGSDFGNSLINLGNELNQHNAQYNIYRGEAPDPREDFLGYLYDKHGLVADAGQTLGSSAPGLIAGLALGPIGTGLKAATTARALASVGQTATAAAKAAAVANAASKAKTISNVIGGIATGVAAGSEMAANVGSDWQDTMQNKYGDAGYNTLNMQWNPETAEAFGQNWTGENASKGVELLASSLMDTAIDIGTGAGTFGLGKVASALGKSAKGADLLASVAAGGEKVTQKVMGTGLRKAALEVAGHATESALGEGLQEAWQQRVQDNIVNNQGEVGDFFTSTPWSGWSDDEQKAFLQAALPSLFTGGLASTGRHIANKLAKDDAENQLGNAMQKEEEGAKADMRQENIEAGRDENAGIDEIGADFAVEDRVSAIEDTIATDLDNGNDAYDINNREQLFQTAASLHPELFEDLSDEQRQQVHDKFVGVTNKQQEENKNTEEPEGTTAPTEDLATILAAAQDRVNKANKEAMQKAAADKAAGKEPQKLSAYGGIKLDEFNHEPSHEQLLDLYRQDHEMDDETYNKLKAQAQAEDAKLKEAEKQAATPPKQEQVPVDNKVEEPPKENKKEEQAPAAPVVNPNHITVDTLKPEHVNAVLAAKKLPTRITDLSGIDDAHKAYNVREYNRLVDEGAIKPEVAEQPVTKTSEPQAPAVPPNESAAKPNVAAPAKPAQQEQAINQPNENKAQAPAPVKVEQKPRDKYEGYWQNTETKSDGSIGKIPGLPSKLTTSVNTALKYMKKHGVDSGRLGKVREAFKQASKDGTQWRITDKGVVQHRQPNSTLDHDIETLKGTIHNAAFALEEAKQRAAAGDKTAQGQVADKERVLNNAITKAKGKLTDEEIQAAQANIATGVQEKLERERNKTKPDVYTTEQVKTEQQPTPVSSSTPTEKNSPDARSTPPVEKVTRDDIPKIKKELTELMRQENAAQDPELRKSLQNKWIKLVATKLIKPFGNDEAKRIFLEAKIDAGNNPEVNTNGTESKQTEWNQNSEEKRGSIGEGTHASETPSNQGQKTEGSDTVKKERRKPVVTNEEAIKKNITDLNSINLEPKEDGYTKQAAQEAANIIQKEIAKSDEAAPAISVGEANDGVSALDSVLNAYAGEDEADVSAVNADTSKEEDSENIKKARRRLNKILREEKRKEEAKEKLTPQQELQQASEQVLDNYIGYGKGIRPSIAKLWTLIKDDPMAAALQKRVSKIFFGPELTQQTLSSLGSRFVLSNREIDTILAQYLIARKNNNKEMMHRRKLQIFAYTLRPCYSHAITFTQNNINSYSRLLRTTIYCINKAIDTYDPTRAVWNEDLQRAVAGPSMVSYINALIDGYAKRSQMMVLKTAKMLDNTGENVYTMIPKAMLEFDKKVLEAYQKLPHNKDGSLKLDHLYQMLFNYNSDDNVFTDPTTAISINRFVNAIKEEAKKHPEDKYAEQAIETVLRTKVMVDMTQDQRKNFLYGAHKLFMGESDTYTLDDVVQDISNIIIGKDGIIDTKQFKQQIDNSAQEYINGTYSDKAYALYALTGIFRAGEGNRAHMFIQLLDMNRQFIEHPENRPAPEKKDSTYLLKKRSVDIMSYISVSRLSSKDKGNAYAQAIKNSEIGKKYLADVSDTNDILQFLENIVLLPDQDYIKEHKAAFDSLEKAIINIGDMYQHQTQHTEEDFKKAFNALSGLLSEKNIGHTALAVSKVMAIDKTFDASMFDDKLRGLDSWGLIYKELGYDFNEHSFENVLLDARKRLKNKSAACGTLVAHLLIAKRETELRTPAIKNREKPMSSINEQYENGKNKSDTTVYHAMDITDPAQGRGRALGRAYTSRSFIADVHQICDMLSLDAYIDHLITSDGKTDSNGNKMISLKTKAMYAAMGLMMQSSTERDNFLEASRKLDNAKARKKKDKELIEKLTAAKDEVVRKKSNVDALIVTLLMFEHHVTRPVWDTSNGNKYLRYEAAIQEDLSNTENSDNIYNILFTSKDARISLQELRKQTFKTFGDIFGVDPKDKETEKQQESRIRKAKLAAAQRSREMQDEFLKGTLAIFKDRFIEYNKKTGEAKKGQKTTSSEVYTLENVKQFLKESGLPNVELIPEDGLLNFEENKGRRVYSTYLKYVVSMGMLCSGNTEAFNNFSSYEMLHAASKLHLTPADFFNFVSMLNASLKSLPSDLDPMGEVQGRSYRPQWFGGFRLMPLNNMDLYRPEYYTLDADKVKSQVTNGKKDKDGNLNTYEVKQYLKDGQGVTITKSEYLDAKLHNSGDVHQRMVKVDPSDPKYHADTGMYGEGKDAVQVVQSPSLSKKELTDKTFTGGDWYTKEQYSLVGIGTGISNFMETFYQEFARNAQAIRMYQLLRDSGVDVQENEGKKQFIVDSGSPKFCKNVFDMYEYVKNNLLPHSVYMEEKVNDNITKITATMYDSRGNNGRGVYKKVELQLEKDSHGKYFFKGARNNRTLTAISAYLNAKARYLNQDISKIVGEYAGLSKEAIKFIEDEGRVNKLVDEERKRTDSMVENNVGLAKEISDPEQTGSSPVKIEKKEQSKPSKAEGNDISYTVSMLENILRLTYENVLFKIEGNKNIRVATRKYVSRPFGWIFDISLRGTERVILQIHNASNTDVPTYVVDAKADAMSRFVLGLYEATGKYMLNAGIMHRNRQAIMKLHFMLMKCIKRGDINKRELPDIIEAIENIDYRTYNYDSLSFKKDVLSACLNIAACMPTVAGINVEGTIIPGQTAMIFRDEKVKLEENTGNNIFANVANEEGAAEAITISSDKLSPEKRDRLHKEGEEVTKVAKETAEDFDSSLAAIFGKPSKSSEDEAIAAQTKKQIQEINKSIEEKEGRSIVMYVSKKILERLKKIMHTTTGELGDIVNALYTRAGKDGIVGIINRHYYDGVNKCIKCLDFLQKRGWAITIQEKLKDKAAGFTSAHNIHLRVDRMRSIFHEVGHAIMSYSYSIYNTTLPSFDVEQANLTKANQNLNNSVIFDTDGAQVKGKRSLSKGDIDIEAKRLAGNRKPIFKNKIDMVYNDLVEWMNTLPVTAKAYASFLEVLNKTGHVYKVVRNGKTEVHYSITPYLLHDIITNEDTYGSTKIDIDGSLYTPIQVAARKFFVCNYCARLLGDKRNYGMSSSTEAMFEESVNYTISSLLAVTSNDTQALDWKSVQGLYLAYSGKKQLTSATAEMALDKFAKVFDIFSREIDSYADLEDTSISSQVSSGGNAYEGEIAEEKKKKEHPKVSETRNSTAVRGSTVGRGQVPITLGTEATGGNQQAQHEIENNERTLEGKIMNRMATILYNLIGRVNKRFDTIGDHSAVEHRDVSAFWNRIWKPRSAVIRDILLKSKNMSKADVRHILVLCTRCISRQEQNNVLVDQRIQDVIDKLTKDPKTGKKLPAKERLYNIRYFNHIMSKSDEFARPLFCKKLLCKGYSNRDYVNGKTDVDNNELVYADTSWSDKFRIFENYDDEQIDKIVNIYKHSYKFAEAFKDPDRGYAIVFATNLVDPKTGKPRIYVKKGYTFKPEDRLRFQREVQGYFNDFFTGEAYKRKDEEIFKYDVVDGDKYEVFDGTLKFQRLFDKATDGRDRIIKVGDHEYRVRGANEERSLLGLLKGVYKDKKSAAYEKLTPELADAWLEYNHIQQDMYAAEMVRETGDKDSINALHTGYIDGRKPHIVGRYLASRWHWDEKQKRWVVYGIGSFMKRNEMRNHIKEYYSNTKKDYHLQETIPNADNPENLTDIIVMSTSQKTLGGGGGYSISGWDRDTTIYGDKEMQEMGRRNTVTAINRLADYVAASFQLEKNGEVEDRIGYNKQTLVKSIKFSLNEMQKNGEKTGTLYTNFDPKGMPEKRQAWSRRLTKDDLETMLAIAERVRQTDGSGHQIQTWKDFIEHIKKAGTYTMASRFAHHRSTNGNQSHLELVNAVDALKLYGHAVANYQALTPFVKEFSSLIFKLEQKEYGPGRERGITVYNELSDFLDLFQGHPTTMDGFIRATSFMFAEALRKIPVIGPMLEIYGLDLSDYWLPDAMNYLMQFQIPAKLGCFNLASGIAQCNQLFNIVALYGWKEFGKAFNQTKTVWGQMAKGAKGQFDPETLAANDKDGIVREVIKDMGITDVGDSFNRNNTGDFVAQDNLFAKLPTKVQEGIEKSMIFFRMGDAGCRVVAIQAAVNHMDHDAKFQQELKAIKEEYKGKNQKELDKAIRQAKIDYAEQFVNDTQFAFNRTSDPYIIQKMGLLGRFLTQFSKYGFATIDFLANTCTNWKQRATILGLGGMFAGISGAIPAYSFFVGIASAMGADADNWIKELLAKLVSEYHMPKAAAEAMGYGVLAPLLGVDISRKVGFQDIVRDPTDPTSFFGPSVNTLRNGVNAICTIPGFATDKYTWDEVMFAFLKDVPVFSNTFQSIRGQHYKYNKFTAKDSPQSMDMAERTRKLLGFADVRNSELNDMSRAIWEAQQEYSNEAKEAQIAFVHNPTEENRKRLIELGKNPEKLKRMDWTLPSQLKRTTNAKTQAAERNRQTITNYANFAGVNPTGLL